MVEKDGRFGHFETLISERTTLLMKKRLTKPKPAHGRAFGHNAHTSTRAEPSYHCSTSWSCRGVPAARTKTNNRSTSLPMSCIQSR